MNYMYGKKAAKRIAAVRSSKNLRFTGFGGVTEIRRGGGINIEGVVVDGKCHGFTKSELLQIAGWMD